VFYQNTKLIDPTCNSIAWPDWKVLYDFPYFFQTISRITW